MKKFLVFSFLVMAICLTFAGCANNTGKDITVTTSLDGKPVLVGNIPSKFPLVKEPEDFNILISVHNDTKQDDVYVWKQYEKMTGINVNWTETSSAECDEDVNIALTNKRKLDLILRCKPSASELTQYGKNGLILDLAKDDMLKKNAPNCWAYLKSHPEALASVTNPDGTIYSLPQINSGAELRVSRKIFINKKWLDNVNMDIPETTEEFYKLMEAFKEKDANGNGDPNDEIPLCSLDWQSIRDVFFGPFGLANRGVHNQLVDYDETTGGVRLIASSDDYKAYLTYMHKLYTQGLIDPNMFTITVDQWSSNAENDKIGAFANTNLALIPAYKTDDWVALEVPLEGPNGNKLWTAIRANFHSTGAAVIPFTCENPELVLKWLDYFWTDEGTLFYHMGIEGKTFVAKKDGTYDYSKKIYKEIKKENKSFDDVVATYSPYPGGGNPTVEIAPYFKGGEMADIPAKAARSLFEYGPDEYWPCFTFTAEENDSLDTTQTDIKKYIDTMEIKFITGETSLSQWGAYKAQLKKLGMNQLLNIYKNAVDRYKALQK